MTIDTFSQSDWSQPVNSRFVFSMLWPLFLHRKSAILMAMECVSQSVSFGSLVAVVVVVLHFAYHKFIFSGSLILNGEKKENICFECVICLCSEQELKGHFPSVSLFISFSLFQENLLSMCVFMQQSNFAGKHTIWRATVCSLHKVQSATQFMDRAHLIKYEREPKDSFKIWSRTRLC